MAKGLKFWKKRLPVTALVLAGAFVAGSASYLAVHDAVSPPPDAGEEEFRLTLPAPSGSSVTVPDEGPAEPPPQEEQPEPTEPETAEPSGMVAVDPSGELPAAADEEETVLSVAADREVALLYVRPVEGTVSKPFSAGELVKSETLGDFRTHDGVDLAAPAGTKVRAMADGTVSDVYADDLLGQTVELRHADGTVTRYCNLAAGSVAVVVGRPVAMGEVLGAVGETALGESAEGAHLHLEVIRGGVRVDPEGLW
ncbi:MAG: M23 family metallopeptidase [Clostridia bacterium]|nr:M23 family metallopeptidase [Clostridia bacterium]